MLTDRFGHIWPTTLTRRSIKAMEDWKFPVERPDPGATADDPQWVTVDVPLGFDVTSIVEFLRMEIDTDLKFEVLAAWLFPHWQKHTLTIEEAGQTVTLTGRAAFDEVCDAAFVNAAVRQLRDLSLSFFGDTGKVVGEEIQKYLDGRGELVRKTIRVLCESSLRSAGTPAPDTSVSETPPTT